jgi:hypothetical protein
MTDSGVWEGVWQPIAGSLEAILPCNQSLAAAERFTDAPCGGTDGRVSGPPAGLAPRQVVQGER